MPIETIYLCGGVPYPLGLGTWIVRWPGKGHTEICTPPLGSLRESAHTILSFTFNFVAAYLAVLNTLTKSSTFGCCREEMKGTNGAAIL